MGIKKTIQTPDELLTLLEEYKADVKANPLFRNEFNAKVGTIVSIPLQRPLSWKAFETYLYQHNIIGDLQDYRYNKDGRYEDFKGIITRINSEFYAEKMEGATVGLYNASIIAKELGLVDKKDLSSKDGTMTPKATVVVQDQKTASEVDKLINNK